MKAYLQMYKFPLTVFVGLVVASLLGLIPASAGTLALAPLFVLAAATFNAREQIPQGRQQQTRRVEFHWRVDYSKHGDGTGLAAGEDMEIGVLPAGYVHERLDAVLRTAEGEAATQHVGIEADDDGFGVSLNVNGTPNAKISVGSPAFVAGEYLHTNTTVRVKTPAATNTVNVAVVDYTFVGYLIDTTLEK